MSHAGMFTGPGLRTNRVDLIHMITNLIESSDIRAIEGRTDASTLAIRIVDGLEDYASGERTLGTRNGALAPGGKNNEHKTSCDL